MVGYEGIVYKYDMEYCRCVDKTICEPTFIRTIANTNKISLIKKYIKKKLRK